MAGLRAPHLEIVERWCKGKGCEICVRACPEYCLAINAADKVAVVREHACTGCRLCELLCPDFAIIVHDSQPAPQSKIQNPKSKIGVGDGL